MARHFKQTDDWETALLNCPKCDWRGAFLEGNNEIHEALTDCTCPQCKWPKAPMLATVSHIVDIAKYMGHRKTEEDK